MRNRIEEIYHGLTSKLIKRGLTISTMESCTGGLIAALFTDASGASEVFENGLITYSNEAKLSYGVSPEIINNFGVYSVETAIEMVRVCKKSFNTDTAVAVTGSIGRKDPENNDSVPNEICFAIDFCGDIHSEKITVECEERMDARYEIAEKIASAFQTFLTSD